MNDNDIGIFLMINEPVFSIGNKQYSVCSPGSGFSTWSSDGTMLDFPDIQSLLDGWVIDGKPFRSIVNTLM